MIISSAVRLNAGLRFSLFNVQGKTYTGLEPRVSLRWLLDDNLSFKASYSRMNQYVHLISNSFISLPTDAWMPVTRKLKPLISDQVSAGFYYNLNKEYNFSVEGYYKTLDNLLEYRDGHTFTPSFVNWEDKLTAGEGRSYGAEFMVRKETGRTTGWVGYGLSWSDRQFDELNQGARYPARFDNRHKLNIVVMHKISPKVELSAAWSYASGNHVTLSLENYYENGTGSPTNNDNHYVGASESIDYYEGRNNYQLPAYHRLDLGIKIYRPKKKGRMGIWTVSIYNVYSRMNPFMIYKSDKTVPDPDAAHAVWRCQTGSSGRPHQRSACGCYSGLWASPGWGGGCQVFPAPFPAGDTAPRSGSHSQRRAAHGCGASPRPDEAPSLRCGYGNQSGAQIPHKIH